MNVVQQHLDKLKVPNTAVRQYAVAALFDALWAPGVSQHVRDAALRQCLQLKDPVRWQQCVLPKCRQGCPRSALGNRSCQQYLTRPGAQPN